MSSIQNPNSLCGHDPTLFVEVDDHHNTFTCCACRTAIVGKRFSCKSCRFNLHPFCKTCPASLSSSTFHPQHPLTLMSTLPGAHPRRWCNVCGDPIEGTRYSCHVDHRCDFDVHPVCSQASRLASRVHHVLDPRHSLELQHQPKDTRYCNVCRGECGGWAYRCGVCSIDIHFRCLLQPAADSAPPAARTIVHPSHGQANPYGFGGGPQSPQPFYFGLPYNAYMGSHYPIPMWPLPPGNYPNGTGTANAGNENATSFMGLLFINMLDTLFSAVLQNGFSGF